MKSRLVWTILILVCLLATSIPAQVFASSAYSPPTQQTNREDANLTIADTNMVPSRTPAQPEPVEETGLSQSGTESVVSSPPEAEAEIDIENIFDSIDSSSISGSSIGMMDKVLSDQGIPEIEKSRNEYGRYYDLGNGKRLALISPTPLHFETQDGNQQLIDNTLVEDIDRSEFDYTNAANAFSAHFPARLGPDAEVMLVNQDNIEIRLGRQSCLFYESPSDERELLLESTQSDGTAVGHAMRYPERYPNIAEEYYLTYGGIKHNYVLDQVPSFINDRIDGFLEFQETLTLPSGSYLSVGEEVQPAEFITDDEIHIRDAQNELVAIIPKARAYETPLHPEYPASHQPTFLEYKVRQIGDQEIEVSVRVPLDWLLAPERGYPVTVDPSATVYGWLNQGADYANDCYQDCSTSFPDDDSATSWISNWGGKTHLTYMRFQNIQIPHGADVQEVTLWYTPAATPISEGTEASFQWQFEMPDSDGNANSCQQLPLPCDRPYASYYHTDNSYNKTWAPGAWNSDVLCNGSDTDGTKGLEQVFRQSTWTEGNYLGLKWAPNTTAPPYFSYEIYQFSSMTPTSYNPPLLEIVYTIPYVYFFNPSYSQDEDGSVAPIMVYLTSPPASTVTVDYSTSDGTAAGDSDYVPINGTLTFIPGDVGEFFYVEINNDSIDELDETVNLTLSNPSDNALLGPSSSHPSTATLTIVDDDIVNVEFSQADYSITEPETGQTNATVTVELSGPAASNVTVNYSTSNGSATAGDDYTSTSGQLTFYSGQISKTFDVPILSDSEVDGGETIDLSLDSPTNAELGIQQTATITIQDSSPNQPEVLFSQADYQRSEGIGTTTIEVVLSEQSSQTVTVDYATSDNTAFAESDYDAASGTVTFAPGSTSETFDLTLIDDSEVESNEIINLTLSNANNAILGSPYTATVSINDNDTPPSNDITRVYEYDYLGRINKEILTVGTQQYDTYYQYDDADRLSQITYPNGEIVTYDYNDRGLPWRLTSQLHSDVLAELDYNDLGQVTDIHYGNNVDTEYTYYGIDSDPLMPTDYYNGYGTLWRIYTHQGSTVINDERYQWDETGNFKEREHYDQGGSLLETEEFGYDWLDRLTNTAVTAGSQPNPYNLTYQYNTIGNIDYVTDGVDTRNYTYSDPQNKPHTVTNVDGTSYQYDSNGNMTNRGAQTIDWNPENMPTTITDSGDSWGFIYDGMGNRVVQTVSSGANQKVTTYVNPYYDVSGVYGQVCNYYLGGMHVAYSNDGLLRYAHTVHLGSTDTTTTDTGSIVGDTDYLPYGETRNQSGIDTEQRFTGQRIEQTFDMEDTGLYYYNARYYDSLIGRFISADTIVPDPANPQSLNRYTYVLNNPLKYTDPSGHAGFLATVVGGAAVGALFGFANYTLSRLIANAIMGEWHWSWSECGEFTAGGALWGGAIGLGIWGAGAGLGMMGVTRAGVASKIGSIPVVGGALQRGGSAAWRLMQKPIGGGADDTAKGISDDLVLRWRGTRDPSDVAAMEQGYLESHAQRAGISGNWFNRSLLGRMLHTRNSESPLSQYVSVSSNPNAAARFGPVYRFWVSKNDLRSSWWNPYNEFEDLALGGTRIHGLEKPL